jgi:hypothetical protein
MAVKYVKDFEFSADRGFHKSAEPMKAKASYGDMPARAKPNAAAMGAKKMESAPGRAKYADGGKSKYVPLSQRTDAESRARALAMSRAMSDKARAPGSAQQKAVDAARARLDASRAAKSGSGMSAQVIIPGTKNGVPGYYTDASRKNFVPTQEQGPIGRRVIPGKPLADFAKRSAQRVSAKYASNPPDSAPEKFVPPVPLDKGGKVEKVMREYKEGKLHSGSKKGPVVKDRKQAMAIALSEARKSGAKIPKKAEGGIFSTEYMASKGPKTRGTPRKGREMGRKDRMDRMALEKMRKAEKYAPGLSIDMPDRKAHGGMPKSRKMMYGGGKC